MFIIYAKKLIGILTRANCVVYFINRQMEIRDKGIVPKVFKKLANLFAKTLDKSLRGVYNIVKVKGQR